MTDQTVQNQTMIADLADDLAGPDLPREDYLATAGRLTNARMTARELLTEPEPTESPSDGFVTAWMPTVQEVPRPQPID